MKHLLWKLIVPLTIISFVVFTKSWEVNIDGDFTETLTGFPLPYVCPGWHTSLSLQIFFSELVINILTYFSWWFAVIFIINRFIKKIKMHKAIVISLLAISGFLLSGLILIASNSDNIYTVKRDFDIEIIETNYEFIWQK